MSDSNDQIRAECEACRQKVADRTAGLDLRITRLEMTMWGQDERNGLRSEIRDMRNRLDALMRFMWVMGSIPPLAVALLAILKFIDKI